MVKNIPSNHIFIKTAAFNKDYEVDFANSDMNSDIYTLKIYLRRHLNQYKIRVVLISSILAYPALEMIWSFPEDEAELSSRVFHRICNEADDIKVNFDKSRMPASTIAAKLREYLKHIATNKQEISNILHIDESNRIAGVSDWRHSIYANRYPNMSKEEKQEIKKYEGNNNYDYINIKSYGTREKY
jgi:hypothetical protein